MLLIQSRLSCYVVPTLWWFHIVTLIFLSCLASAVQQSKIRGCLDNGLVWRKVAKKGTFLAIWSHHITCKYLVLLQAVLPFSTPYLKRVLSALSTKIPYGRKTRNEFPHLSLFTRRCMVPGVVSTFSRFF